MTCDRRVMVEGEDQDYILSYRLVPRHGEGDRDPETYYGIRVEEYVIRDPEKQEDELSIRRADQREIRGLSEDRREAESFLNMIAEGTVFPVSLYEIYDDWMSAFHPRWAALT